MTKADLLQIDRIGEPIAAKLVADGITTKSELKTVLQEVSPPARHIYSNAQTAVLAALDLPTIGAPSVSQYTRQPGTERELQYRWDRQPESLVLQLRKKPPATGQSGRRIRGNHSAESTTTLARVPKTRLLAGHTVPRNRPNTRSQH